MKHQNINIDLIIDKVVQWHYDRNLIGGSSDQAQFVKLVEEVGELANNISRGGSVTDDIGDIMVVLINIAARNGVTLKECLKTAWGDIEHRKGRMVDGIFVKEE